MLTKVSRKGTDQTYCFFLFQKAFLYATVTQQPPPLDEEGINVPLQTAEEEGSRVAGSAGGGPPTKPFASKIPAGKLTPELQGFLDSLPVDLPGGLFLGRYRVQRVLPINCAFSFRDLPTQSLSPVDREAHRIVIQSSVKSFILLCLSADHKESWLRALRRVRENFQVSSFGNEVSEPQVRPVLQNLSSVSHCPICKLKFEVLSWSRRKRHCALCGAVICGKCCGQVWMDMQEFTVLGPVSQDPGVRKSEAKKVRICEVCFKSNVEDSEESLRRLRFESAEEEEKDETGAAEERFLATESSDSE